MRAEARLKSPLNRTEGVPSQRKGRVLAERLAEDESWVVSPVASDQAVETGYYGGVLHAGLSLQNLPEKECGMALDLFPVFQNRFDNSTGTCE